MDKQNSCNLFLPKLCQFFLPENVHFLFLGGQLSPLPTYPHGLRLSRHEYKNWLNSNISHMHVVLQPVIQVKYSQKPYIS